MRKPLDTGADLQPAVAWSMPFLLVDSEHGELVQVALLLRYPLSLKRGFAPGRRLQAASTPGKVGNVPA